MEYEVPGVPQVPVNEKFGVTFATALRALLRQDPDVLLVGEIRNEAHRPFDRQSLQGAGMPGMLEYRLPRAHGYLQTARDG